MPADGPAMPRDAAHWTCVTPVDDGVRLTLVASGRYPDAMRVELLADIARVQIGQDARAEVDLDDDHVVRRLRVQPAYAPKAPPIWFAELRENNARPPAVNLIAFVDAGQPAGAVLDETALTSVPVSSDDQLGAVRWFPGNGEVDQVYVQPAWRRRSVGSMLVIAAEALSVARRWPRLWSDGQRTELGETWRNHAFWRDRAQPLTHVAPAMTPARSR